MNGKKQLLVTAFVGAFTLGAMFAPIGEPTATTNDQVSTGKLAVFKTGNEKDIPQVQEGENICPLTGEAMGNRTGMGKYFKGSMRAVIADALGMTEAELQDAHNDGKSVSELAKTKGVKVDVLLSKMMESRKASFEQLVKEKKITLEQMDAMLKNMESMMKTAIERDSFGPMNGRGGGKMGMGQGGRCSGGAGNQQID